MKKIVFLLMMSTFTFCACNQQSLGENAEVSEAKDVQEATTETIKFSINTENSITSFIGSKPAGIQNGTIEISEGYLALTKNQITGGRVVLDMNSVTSSDFGDDNEMLNMFLAHLKSPDFFDTANHPTAEFIITSVEAYDATDSVKIKDEYDSEFKPAAANEYIVQNPTHKVTGNLTLRSITLSIAFPAKLTVEESIIKAEAKFNIDRTLWGVMYGDEASVADKAKDKFVYNTVNIGLILEADKTFVSTGM